MVKENKMKLIEINLSRAQIKQLRPLFEEADRAYYAGKPGGIFLLQPFKSGHSVGYARAGFLPEKEAKQLLKILKRL